MQMQRSWLWALGLAATASAWVRQSLPFTPASDHLGPARKEHAVSILARSREPIALRVVYPAPADRVRAPASSFLLGSVSSRDVQLTINGSKVRVWADGAWLAWLPFPPDSVMQFRIAATRAGDTTQMLYLVRRDQRFLPGEVHSGAVWLESMSLTPRGQAWVPGNEYMTLSVRAAEATNVRIQLPDGSTLPHLPQRQPEEVLPAIRAFEHDTTKLLTPDEVRFVGVVRGKALGPDPGPVLRGPSPALIQVLGRAVWRCVTGAACPTPYADLLSPDSGWATLEAAVDRDTVRVRWPLQIALLDTLPLVTEFDDDTMGTGKTDSLTPGRATPGGPYQWFLPTGTRSQVTARLNEDLRIRLSPGAVAWVPASDARPLPRGIPAPSAVVGSVTLSSLPDRVALRIPLTQRVPFQVLESEQTLSLRFYSSVADVDWIRYGGDTLIQRLRWSQSSNDELSFTAELTQPVSGYRPRWDRNDLLFEIRRPPVVSSSHPLRGRRIAIDPGPPPLG